jgi:protoporphyrinogen oxidase
MTRETKATKPYPTTSVDVLIIGAGVSGLSCAVALHEATPDVRVLVLERDGKPGGYCRTVEQDGFRFDYSGHFFHFRDPATSAWFHRGMATDAVATITKRARVRACGVEVDFPFQRSLQQLPAADRDACLEGLRRAAPQSNHHSFKQRMRAQLGEAICTRFIEPYNEKLYACDLDDLDSEAMGRFFPHTSYEEALRGHSGSSYNDVFRYPRHGAGAYISNLLARLPPNVVHCHQAALSIDVEANTVTTASQVIHAKHIISSVPLPSLMKLCRQPVDRRHRASRVAVFNLGFASKGRDDVHWLYFADRALPFYRVGYYDNIHNDPRMALYVEVGVGRDEPVDWDAMFDRVAAGLRREGLWTDENRLISRHQVMLDPAYVLMTGPSQQQANIERAWLAERHVHSIGRYGRWTYCSIEDNVIEARALAGQLF